jgi:3'(2'), 5'-bisphosphate nucleotidase
MHLLNSGQLHQLCLLARQAGSQIMEVYAQGGEVLEKPDRSPLTEADLRADRVIAAGLHSGFGDWPVVSEESGAPPAEGRAADGTFFLVDPLDGTREFLQRNGEFTVNIALVQAGQPVAGVVYAPALDELFFGAAGLGVFKRDATGTRPIRTSALLPGQTLRVLGSRSHGADRVQQWLAGLNRPYSFVPAGSSLKFCRVAEGAADVYPRLGPTSQWDTAAAQAIVELAGGVVLDLQGQPLRYGTHRSALNPEFMVWGDSRAAR